MKIFGWITSLFSGFNVYALIGLGVVVLALSGAVAFQYEQHQADVAKRQQLQTSVNGLQQDLRDSEADKALLARKTQELDAAIQERDSRLKALNDAKSKLAKELDVLKKTLPAPDQSCLARDLPSPLLDLLRNGPVGGDPQHPDAGPGKSSPPLS